MESFHAFELLACSCYGVDVGVPSIIATSLVKASYRIHIFRTHEMDAFDLEVRKKTLPKDMDQVTENNSSSTDSWLGVGEEVIALFGELVVT